MAYINSLISDWYQVEKYKRAHTHIDIYYYEFEWTPGVTDGQGGLGCCDSWGRKESDMTEWLNWTELILSLSIYVSSVYLFVYTYIYMYRATFVYPAYEYMYVCTYTCTYVGPYMYFYI